MGALISVIVPVYKVEKYLCRCIDSIINQNYKNLEIILIDDGSPDQCGKICDEYAKKDDRIKVIHKENGGVSKARNSGLDVAKGDYVGFVDGDDYIAPDMYENLIYEAEKDSSLDFLQCEYKFLNHADEILKTEKSVSEIIEQSNIIYQFFNYDRVHKSVCSKIFKRELISSMRFNTEYAIGEDALFVFECCRKANKIKLLGQVGYYYYQREDSAVHQAPSEKNFDLLKVMDVYKRYYNKKDKFYSLIVMNDVMACMNVLVRIIKYNVFNERFESIRKRLLENKWQVLFKSQYHWKFKIVMLLLWVCPEACKIIYGQVKRIK